MIPALLQSPQVVEFVDQVGPFYFRSIFLPAVGMRVSQHIHDYDHATLCGSGKARLYVDGKETQIVEAGQAVEIKAYCRHEFESLECNTRLTCVHDPKSAEMIRERGI